MTDLVHLTVLVRLHQKNESLLRSAMSRTRLQYSTNHLYNTFRCQGLDLTFLP